MGHRNGEWVSYYMHSRNTRRAADIVKPQKDESGWHWGQHYLTKEEAIKGFSKELGNHVTAIIKEVKSYSSNDVLKKRLHQYGNMEALQALENFEKIIDSIPKFNET